MIHQLTKLILQMPAGNFDCKLVEFVSPLFCFLFSLVFFLGCDQLRLQTTPVTPEFLVSAWSSERPGLSVSDCLVKSESHCLSRRSAWSEQGCRKRMSFGAKQTQVLYIFLKFIFFLMTFCSRK